jgi:streptomycin 6-kinase
VPQHTLRSLAQQWDVVLEGEILETPTGCVGFGRRAGDSVVLKLPNPDADEAHSAKALMHFGGSGAVRVLAHAHGAMLLERATPGRPLTDLVTAGRDDQATAIICDVVAALHRVDLPAHIAARFPLIEDWGRELESCRDGAGVIPPDLIDRAISCFRDLARSQGPRRLLHGDLHHHNILSDDRRGWIAIDPKGVIGETAYEIGAALRNPTSDPAVFAVPSIIERRISIVSERLALDPDRVMRWAFAQGVLSAVWRVADGRDPRRGLATASAILAML